MCFSQKESKTIYSTFFDAFKLFFDLSLDKYKLLSDQGSSLKALAKEKNIDHYYCLRHALKSLGEELFAFEVGQLIQCKTFEEFQKLKVIFERQFKDNITDSKAVNELNRMLRKVGLNYNESTIIILDHPTFHRFSMIFRSIETVCTTSNCLEGYHGHLNAKVPRNNKFWSALATQIDTMEAKVNLIDHEVRHNILARVRHLRVKGKLLTEEEFENERNYFNTNADTNKCDCNENIIVDQLFRMKLPCHHLLRNKQEFDPRQADSLNTTTETDRTIIYWHRKPLKQKQNTEERLSARKEKIIGNIIRFTSRKFEKIIRKKVFEFFDASVEFVNGYPVALIELMSSLIWELNH
jgi:hypothetical protein